MSQVRNITVEQLSDMLGCVPSPLVLDVREKWENELCSLPGHRWIPLGELAARINELPKNQIVVAYCHHGGRSARAVDILQKAGFDEVFNLQGGIHAWSQRIDSLVKIYE